METIPLRGHHVTFFTPYAYTINQLDPSEEPNDSNQIPLEGVLNAYGLKLHTHMIQTFNTLLEGKTPVRIIRGYDRLCRPNISDVCASCKAHSGLVEKF